MSDNTLVPTQVAPQNVRSKKSSILIVVSLILLSEVASFEYNMISPALPNIAAHFQTPNVGLVFTVMLLTGGVVLPILGKLGDIYGKKRILLCGVTALSIGAVLCAVAPTFELLLAGRALQAFGMVALTLTYGLIRDLLPPRYVPIGLGAIGMGVGVSAIIGPLLGGWLIDSAGYQAPFWFLAGYAVATMALVILFVPETSVRAPHRIDYLGALLLGAGVGLLIYATAFSALRIVAVPLGLVLLCLFVAVERRIDEPLISLKLLQRRAVWMTLLLACMIGLIFNSNVSVISQMLRSAPLEGINTGLGLTAIEFALFYALSLGASGAVAGMASGFISRRWGPKYGLLLSTFCWFIGSVLVATGYVDVTGMVLVLGIAFGLGMGSYHASVSNLVVEAVPATTQGVVASMKTTGEQLAGAIGTSALGIIVASSVVQIDPATRAVSYHMGGFQIVYAIYAAVALIAFVIVLRMSHGSIPASGGTAVTEAH